MSKNTRRKGTKTMTWSKAAKKVPDDATHGCKGSVVAMVALELGGQFNFGWAGFRRNLGQIAKFLFPVPKVFLELQHQLCGTAG